MVLVIDDDNLEDEEDMTVTLSEPRNAVLSDPVATGTIEDDDANPSWVRGWRAAMLDRITRESSDDSEGYTHRDKR